MNNAIEPRSLGGVLWQVEDIDGGGIIDSSHVTLQITDDTGISGSTGCNRYFGAVAIEGSAFVADAIGSTRMACAPALMEQEQRFVQALQAVREYELKGSFLLLYDEDRALRLRMIAADESASAPGVSEKPDHGAFASIAQRLIEFRCEQGSEFEAAFQAQESLTLTFAGEQRILRAERAASGAKYVGERVILWNKGNEAMIEWDGQTFNCLQKG